MKAKTIVLVASVPIVAGALVAAKAVLDRQFQEYIRELHTPESTTETAMTETEFRIKIAYAAGMIPHDLEDLPKRPGYANSTVDGWGTELRFEFEKQADGTARARVLSAGSDGLFATDDDQISSFVVCP